MSIGDGCAADTNGESTLRAALMEASAWDHRPLIDMTALPMGAIVKLYAPLEIRKPVDVLGPGAEKLAISAQGEKGTLYVQDTCAIEGVALVHGNGSDYAVELAAGEMHFENCTFRGNRGGVLRQTGGNSYFSNCTFEDNAASPDGGIIFLFPSEEASMTLDGCRFLDNESSGDSAILSFGPPLRIVNSSFQRNTIASGGVVAGDRLDIFNCTFSGNKVAHETVWFVPIGSPSSYGRLTNCTIVRNIATSTGTEGTIEAVAGLRISEYAEDARIYNSIIAGNLVVDAVQGRGPDVSGHATDAAFNMIGDLTGSTGFVGRNNVTLAELGVSELGDVLNPLPNQNGGTTLSHALVSGSPALNRGYDHYLNVSALAPWKNWDQRGAPYVRVAGGGLDLGAYEYQAPLVTTPDEYAPPNQCVDVCVEACDLEPLELDLSQVGGLYGGSLGFSPPFVEMDLVRLMPVYLLAEVLASPEHPLYCCARRAFDHNSHVWEAAVEQVAPALYDDLEMLLSHYFKNFPEVFVAIMTAGDVAAFVNVQEVIEDGGGSLEINDLDRTLAGVFGPYGDVDGDGVCNLGEYLAYYQETQDETLSNYLTIAMDPTQASGERFCNGPCGQTWPTAEHSTVNELLEHFDFLDADHDGELSWQEAAFWGIDLEEFFSLDLNGDEMIERTELMQFNTARGFHAADQDDNFSININELLRIVQLFNSDGFYCHSGSEDGYSPGGGSNKSCARHSADMDGNWRINLSELLRVVQLFNVGGYVYCPFSGTEDGFCVEPGGA